MLPDQWKFLEPFIPVIPEDHFPPVTERFAAFRLLPKDVKVVLLGQDPYPSIDKKINRPAAMGMSFSVPNGGKIPPSLSRVFKELKASGYTTDSSDLTPWVDQGVLLLNTTLTVKEGKSNSDKKQWKEFTSHLMVYLKTLDPIFVLWGNNAVTSVGDMDKITCFVAGHPSPLNRSVPFLGCDHFNKVNNELVTRGKEVIDWSL